MTKDSVRLNKSHDKHRILLCRYWASLVSIFPTGTVTSGDGKGARVGRFTLILIGISRWTEGKPTKKLNDLNLIKIV